MIINVVRGLVKSAGDRLPSCSTESFAERTPVAIPACLTEVSMPLQKQIGLLTTQIDLMDKQIEKLVRKYPEISLLRTTPGVGPLVAACYVLTLDSPDVLGDNRQAGAFLGLRPRQSQSGASDPQREHLQDWQQLPTQLAGAIGAIYPGPLRSRLGTAPLGPQAGCQWRQTGQETRHRRRGSQTGRPAAQHVAKPRYLFKLFLSRPQQWPKPPPTHHNTVAKI